MPRYYFNVHDGIDVPDPIGTFLPDIEAARRHACTYSGEILRDGGDTFWRGHEWTMNVCDKHGLVLFSLLFVAINAASEWKPHP